MMHGLTKVKYFCFLNPLTPNDPYMGRTALLTFKRCILYIYSTNIGTEYFKHALYSRFSSKCSLFHNANLFGSCIIHILYTECARIKNKFRRQRVKIQFHILLSSTSRSTKLFLPSVFKSQTLYAVLSSDTRSNTPLIRSVLLF